MTRESTYPEIMRIGEVSMYLRCSEKTALKYCREGCFPNAFRLGKYWRIPKADVIAFTHTQR